MRLATFADPGTGEARAGQVCGDLVVEMRGETVLERLASGDRTPADGAEHALAELTLLAPVPRPRAIFGIGLNYAAPPERPGAIFPRRRWSS